jgi:hypothetical protein
MPSNTAAALVPTKATPVMMATAIGSVAQIL